MPKQEARNIWRIYALTPSAEEQLAKTKQKVKLYAAEHNITLQDALSELVEWAYDESQRRKNQNQQPEE